jgi:hypothetical protein
MENRNHYRDMALRENDYGIGRNVQTYDTVFDKHEQTGPSQSESYLEHPGRDLHHSDVSDDRSQEATSNTNILRNTIEENVKIGNYF